MLSNCKPAFMLAAMDCNPMARAHFGRLTPIPLGRGEPVVVVELPARVGGVDRVVGVVPRHVGVGVEVLHH